MNAACTPGADTSPGVGLRKGLTWGLASKGGSVTLRMPEMPINDHLNLLLILGHFPWFWLRRAVLWVLANTLTASGPQGKDRAAITNLLWLESLRFFSDGSLGGRSTGRGSGLVGNTWLNA